MLHLAKPKQALVTLVFLALLSPLAVLGQGHNLKIGPVPFNLTASFSATYDSNINASGTNAKSDIILSPGITLAGQWEATELNTLSFGIGLRYHKYLDHPELDSANNFLTITPETAIGFDVYLGENFFITIEDTLTFSSDPTDVSVVDPDSGGNDRVLDVFSYTRFNNRLSATGTWLINPFWQAQVGASRADVWPINDDRFNILERTEYSVFGSLSRQINEDLRLGVQGSWRHNEYDEDFQNDSESFSYGIFGELKVSDNLSATASVGWYESDFDTPDGTTGNDDYTDPDGMTYSMSLAHTVNEDYAHTLTVSRSFSYGYVSNTIRTTGVRYGFTWQGVSWGTIDGGLGWESGVESGGFQVEEFDRFIFTIGTSYRINNRTDLGFNYSFSTKDSNLASRSYDRHRVWVTLTYDF